MSQPLDQPQSPNPDYKLVTQCKECVFREGLEDCKLGRIEVFKKLGVVELVGSTNEIHGRLCISCRNDKTWPDGKDLSSEEQIELVKKEISLRYAGLVYVGEDSTLEELEKSLFVYVGVDQKHRPKQINIIVNKNAQLKPTEIIKFMRTRFTYFNIDTLWTVNGIVIELSKEACIDYIVRQINPAQINYYYLLEAGQTGNHINELNERITVELEQLLEQHYYDGYFCQVLYHLIGKNDEKDSSDIGPNE